MKKLIKEIINSFKKRPVWTMWSLLLAPLFYTLVFFAAVLLAMINLDMESGISFWGDNV